MKSEEFRRRLYEDVICLIRFLQALPKDIITREIISQLMRSGTSIGANYFEAHSASSGKDFQNYFTHALKSANESKFWFNVLLDSQLVPPASLSECKRLLAETEEIAKILTASILTMKRKN